jgi:arylsulfatase A-like enzyme
MTASYSRFLRVVLRCVALVLPSALPAADERPNIVLIISDDHAFVDYGFMGGDHVNTPHIDRMAAQSQLYTRGYATPVCSPSLATLLTGLYPHQHGITGNDLKQDRTNRTALSERLFQNPLILPKALSDAGYLTMQTGKLWNMSYQNAGFTDGMTGPESRHGGAGLDIGRKGMKPIFNFIDKARDAEKPFFVWYAPFLPHDPHNPPDELLQKYRGKGPTPAAEKYFAMVEWLDRTCGELDAYLDAHGLTENTLVLYLADNGWDAARGYKDIRAKLSPYEMGIRTPIFARWPAKLAPHRDDETLASIIDIVPTIIAATGIDAPSDLPGLNLMDRDAMAARKSIFVQSYTHDIADLARPVESLMASVVIDGWHKLVIPGTATPDRPHASAPASAELFDLKTDPLEKNNLAAEKPEIVDRLKQLDAGLWQVD